MSTAARPDPKPLTFTFENIGPVRQAELELGNLTIIAGRNNTGKTYLVYTLYGFLQMWHTWPRAAAPYPPAREPAPADAGPRRRILDEIVEQTADKGRAEVSVDRAALANERKTILQALTRSFSREALANVFSSPPDAFEGATLGVGLDPTVPDQFPEVEVRIGSDPTLAMGYDGTAIHVIPRGPERNRPGHAELLSQQVSWLYLRCLFPDLPVDPFVLCAERFGISLFYKELDFTKNRLVDLLQQLGDKKQDDRYLPFLLDRTISRYAIPIKHNIDYTRDIPELRKLRSELYDDKLFDGVKAMMKASYKVSGDDIEFKSTARGKGRFSIPLHRASSSARGLSDLYFFLRHVCRHNQLLIIDEPEGHLDTANQIQLARLLARLARAGPKIVLTTHSDYLVKEINNLVMLDGLPDRAAVARRLGYRENDHLAPDMIRAYVTEANGLTRCKVDHFGIDMPVFDDTIDGINRVANALSARLPSSEDGAA